MSVKVLVAATERTAGQLVKSLETARVEVQLVTDAAAALNRFGGTADVVLLDFEMPGLGGTRGVQMVRAALGDRALGVILAHHMHGLARRALAAGATGVLPDDADPETLAVALTLLARGQRFVIFSRGIHTVPLNAVTALTDRELQVLQGVCEGLQNKEIAHHFGVREVTVKMHVHAIIRKLGARNRTHAAMIARDLEIV